MPLVDSQEEEGSPELVAALVNRFPSQKNGLMVADSGRTTPYLFLAATEFELWIAEIEDVIGIPIGRKLAHAAAESEEFRLECLREEMPNPIFGRMKKRIEWINRNWELRNLGQLQLLKVDKSGATIIVHSRPHSSIGAGMSAATYEYLTGNRFKFHWSDDGYSETLVTLELDGRNIPAANRIDGRWKDADGGSRGAEGMHPLSLAFKESSGCWSIDGIRLAAIPQDLLLRMEESLLPTILDSPKDEGCRFTWHRLSDREREKVWSAFAEASKRRFLTNDAMVLIAEVEHWVHIGHRFLSRSGLGAIQGAESIDENGGVRLSCRTLYHPALACGLLAGVWERSEGRPASVSWSSDHKGHIIEISSQHTINQHSC